LQGVQSLPVNRVPAKYATLKQAERAGLTVPRSLLLDGEQSEADIAQFLDGSTDSRFIVRSAVESEDSSEHSLAGHFWSSDAVARELVAETITQAQQANQAVLDSLQSASHPQLILQEYIEHTVGGVLFSPWSFFTDYAYIEYSDAGVKRVVEGGESHSAVLCVDAQYADPLPLLDALSHLKSELVSLCNQLRGIYDFPVDCEWAYNSQTHGVVVLQVRPQTHFVGPVLPCSKADAHSLNDWSGHGIDHAITSADLSEAWQFTALSESLGRLSPLSFSLLKQLYTDSIPTLHLLGCKAKSVDFMRYAPDGTVLVDPRREQSFYKLSLFGGFQRGMHQAKIQQEAQLAINEYDHSAAFSYDTLLQLFRYWIAANICSAGAGRERLDGRFASDSPHGYELAWEADLAIEKPAKLSSWNELNRWGRALFLFELNKLKRELGQATQQANDKTDPHNPSQQSSKVENYKLFCTWSEYQAGDYQSGKSRQHQQAPYALYDFAFLSADESGDIQSLASGKTAEGPVYIIENPSVVNDIPADCILITPYFDNRWVGLIRYCKGIVVTRGSRLSHSAIVAREYDVPYYVMPQLSLDTLQNGQQMVLDSTGLKSAKPP
jgi:phosphohistidine swiveling domain-containing protein